MMGGALGMMRAARAVGEKSNPWATGAKLGADVLPFVLSLFGDRGKSPEDSLRDLTKILTETMRPAEQAAVGAAVRQGSNTGSAVRQNMADSVGRIGGGSAGATRAVRSLASSAASNQASQGAADARMRVAQFVTQLATEAAPGFNDRQRPSAFNTFLQGLSGVTAAEGNPFRRIVDGLLSDSGPGESPIKFDDIIKVANSPIFHGGTAEPTDYGTTPRRSGGRTF